MSAQPDLMSSRSSLSFSAAPSGPTTEVSLDLDDNRTDDRPTRNNLLGKVADLLHKTMLRSRENSVDSQQRSPRLPQPTAMNPLLSTSMLVNPSTASTIVATQDGPPATLVWPSRVRETKHVLLEYDPLTKRKVLNTYEILREIGRGEHGKVKLARDLVHDELVAIKIVSRNKKDRLLRMRKSLAHPANPLNDYEAKIRREIAIMKRCDHDYIVSLKEVLDDIALYKIYLVLEYMDRGEIKWKRTHPIDNPLPHDVPEDAKLPCCANNKRGLSVSVEDNDLLSNTYSPNLTFRQSRRIFRDVLLGLEYLHMQGIVHRDIKPANLLVNSDYVVKISDFGVSFALSLSNTDDGLQMSEMDLAKTVGTPAFFAPELCQTNFSSNNSAANLDSTDLSQSTSQSSSSVPKVDHKIDIWALGVTLYCLLFGKVPFNADNEFALFDVIVNQPLVFPESPDSFHSPQVVSDEEFNLAKDLLSHMLAKNSRDRYDIAQIKEHPFVLLDLEDDIEKLQELFFLNTEKTAGVEFGDTLSVPEKDITQDEIDNAVVGVGNRIKSGLMKAINTHDGTAFKRLSLKLEHSISSSSESSSVSHQNSSAHLISHAPSGHSYILSEALLALTSHDTRNNSFLTASKVGLALYKTTSNFSSAQRPQLADINSTFSSHSSVSSQPQQKSPTMVSTRSNLVLLDVFDGSSSARKDSSGSTQEAPQIETKRNVGGDLYLKNQSAIDAFKDIQHQDQRRRKSSIFASLSQSSSSCASPRPSKENTQLFPNTPVCTPVVTGSSSETEGKGKIKIGPISFDSGRRPSSVISLPLTESFASLDSDNDEYLTSKYQEYRKKKHGGRLQDEGHGQSDSGIAFHNGSNDMTERFHRFNLGSLMASGKATEAPRIHSEGVGPRTTRTTSVNQSSSSRSGSFSESSCSTDSDDSDSDQENLTLKFASKVAPISRPPFLSLSNRAYSHDSNLTDLANQQSPNYYDVPIVFQDHLLEFEDVPEDLMGGPADARLSDMLPSVSGMTSNLSSATITNDINRLRMPTVAPAQSSPLRKEVVGSPNDSKAVEKPIAIGRSNSRMRRKPSATFGSQTQSYFINHYKKELSKIGFPFAKHLDADRESTSKQQYNETGASDGRPQFIRSNSITLGLLQHERSISE